MTRSQLNAEEVRRRFLDDEEFRKRYNQPGARDYDERRFEAIVAYFTEAIPVLDDLERHGYVASQIGSLGARYKRFDDVLPVLMDWAHRLPLGQVWADILETISTPWAKETVGPFLIGIYPGAEAKWRPTIARCLPSVASLAIEDDLIRLATGIARADSLWCRERILAALAKLKTPRAERVVLEFSSDPEDPVRLVVAKSLANFSSDDTLQALRELALDSKSDVAKAARAALKKIERKTVKAAKSSVRH